MNRHALGLMTGTSLDGIDAAMIEATGRGRAVRARVLGHVEDELGPVAETLRAAAEGEAIPAIDFLRAGRRLGERYAEVAAACVERFLPGNAMLSLAAAHGQTICHAPEEGLSWQLLDPGPLAERLGCEVVWDLRQADLATGGQGAPITPLADAALYEAGPGGTLVVNLGGIVNATRLPGGDGPPEGGDVCACNLLLDGLVRRLVPGVAYDDGGRRAAAGRVDPVRVRRILEGPGFVARGTLGREQVGVDWLTRLIGGIAGDAAVADLLADAAEAVARGVAGAAERWPADRVVLAGGGVRNRALVAAIRGAVGLREVLLSEAVGVPSQAREAAGMAVLGLLAADGAATTEPGITGATRASVGGRWCRPSTPAPTSPSPLPLVAASPEDLLPGADRLDAMETPELLSFLHAQDAVAVAAVTPALPVLAQLVDDAAAALDAGGRLIYLGAGTSGRLGVLDASELPPTFSADATEVLSFIAGGDGALRKSAEGAEDDPAGAVAWLDGHRVGAGDVVLGIAASGTTPVVLGGLAHARAAGAKTALLSCGVADAAAADRLLHLATGAEAVSGSTRMKAGTATKLTLNLLTTAVMVRRGKVWGGWMVDVKASNAKLVRRANRILRRTAGLDEAEAAALLDAAGGRVKLALAMHATGLDPRAAGRRLAEAGGRLRPLLGPPPA